MKLPQIRMESQMMKLGLRTIPAQLSIKQQRAIQRIEQKSAEIEIRTKPGRLTIDQSQAFAEANLKSIYELNKEYARLGKQKWLEGVARRAREGRELMSIEKKDNPLVRQAVEKSHPPPKRLGIAWIPSYGSVKFHYEPAEVEINVTTHKPVIETIPQKPVIRYKPGDVHVYVAQKNDLRIWFENLFDEMV